MKKVFFFTMILVLTISCVNAQDSTMDKHKWTFLIEPYLMFPSMNGTTGIGNLPAVDVDVNSNQIFSNLKFGAMLFFEARKGDWAFNSDLLYMSLGQDVKTGTVINSGDIGAKQLGWEVAGLLQITPWLELGPALMLNSVKMDVDITVNNIGGGTTARSNGLSQTWGDLLLVARIKSKEGKKFLYQLRGDVGGGFGASKNAVWQVQAYAGYRFSKLFQLTGGYRVISLDYEKGTGKDYFLFDVNTSGPVIRFGFNL
jgi:hypothetical protein